MKKLFLLIFICGFLIPAGFTQTIWTDPVPLTDSITDNANVNLPYLFSSYNDSIFSVWEKSVGNNSTAIYGRNIATMSPPFVILSQPDVHFRHPVVLDWLSGDTVLLVIYETNMNGNWDIYYTKYLRDGTTAPPVPICNSAQDEINFRYHQGLGFVWEQVGAIMFKNFTLEGFPNPVITVTLDQGNCHRPALSSSYCSWEKIGATDTSVYYSAYQYATTSWGTPLLLTGGVNKNISSGDGDGSYITWQAKEDGLWRLKFADLYSPDFYMVNDFPGANNIQPCFTNIIIVTKGSPIFPSFLSFASDYSGSYEIYANNDFWDTTLINISNHHGINLHPQFYSSFRYNYGYMTIFLFWESLRNNHWQIWMSYMDIPMGVDDKNSRGDSRVENYPNPFSGSTTINYETAGESRTTVEIYNTLGMKIKTLKEGTDPGGKQTVIWDGKDSSGTRVVPGIYICSLRINGRIYQQKICLL